MGPSSAATRSDRTQTAGHFRVGLLFAVGSALAFGMSGPLAKSLMEAGWTPTAAVTARTKGLMAPRGRGTTWVLVTAREAPTRPAEARLR